VAPGLLPGGCGGNNNPTTATTATTPSNPAASNADAANNSSASSNVSAGAEGANNDVAPGLLAGGGGNNNPTTATTATAPSNPAANADAANNSSASSNAEAASIAQQCAVAAVPPVIAAAATIAAHQVVAADHAIGAAVCITSAGSVIDLPLELGDITGENYGTIIAQESPFKAEDIINLAGPQFLRLDEYQGVNPKLRKMAQPHEFYPIATVFEDQSHGCNDVCLIWDLGISTQRFVENLPLAKLRLMMNTTPKLIWIKGTFVPQVPLRLPHLPGSALDLTANDGDIAEARAKRVRDAKINSQFEASEKWQAETADILKLLHTEPFSKPSQLVECCGLNRELDSYHFQDCTNQAGPTNFKLSSKYEFVDVNDSIPLLWRWQSFGAVACKDVSFFYFLVMKQLFYILQTPHFHCLFRLF
jgi:hypothetical protein